MKKIIYILFLSVIVFVGIDKVSAEVNTCIYEFHGAVITVSEVAKKQAFFELDESNATKQWVDSDGKEVEDITYLLKLKQKEFFVAEKFTCVSSFSALISKYKSTPGNWEKVEFSHSKPDCSGIWNNCDRYEIVELKQQLDRKNSCVYSVSDGGSVFQMVVRNLGNGKARIGQISNDNSGLYVISTAAIDSSIFFQDGKFNCENIQVEGEICPVKDSKRKSVVFRNPGAEKTCKLESEDVDVVTDKNLVDDTTNSSNWDSTSGKTIAFVQKVYSIIKILIPVLIVVLSIVDFLRVLLVSDDKSFKSAWDKFIKRIVIGVIFFILPVIISFLINLSGLSNDYEIFTIFT